MDGQTGKGARVYHPLILKIYDGWVLGISNRFAWRCLTGETLLPHFLRHIGAEHLDVGVGTGYYLKHAPDRCTLSLLDLNPASLNAAATRVGHQRIRQRVQHDVFYPYPAALLGRFDSVSMFYLLHCLPGDMLDKQPVIDNAAAALNEHGVLYGATILGAGVKHNAFGRKLLDLYNQKGIFANRGDSAAKLHHILAARFTEVNVSVQGAVALFAASGKRS